MLFKSKNKNPLFNKFTKYQNKMVPYYRRWKKNYLFYNNKMWVSVDDKGKVLDAEQLESIANILKFRVKGNRLLSDIYAVIASLMQSKPYITVLPKTSGDDDKEKSIYTTKFLNAFMYEQGLFSDKYQWLLLKGLLYGTPAVFVGYEKTHYVVDYDDNGEPLYNLRYIVRPISPFDFVVNPDIENYDDQIDVYYLRTMNKEVAEKLYPDITIGTNEYSEAKYVKDNNEVITLIEYYRRSFGGRDRGELVRMTNDGTILYEGENPYGEELPVIYSQYYKIPGHAYGKSPVDVAKVWESIRNLTWSLMLQNQMIAGNIIAIAPDGAFPEDINIAPGSVITYDPTATGQNNIPKLWQGQGITSGWEAIYSQITQEYQDAMTTHDIYYGRAPASASGKAKELTRAYVDFLKYPAQMAFQDVLKRMANKVIKDVQADVFKYWDDERIMRYLGDDDQWVIFNFTKQKIDAGDIEVRIGKDLPYTKEQFTELVFQNALQRLASDPKDWETKKIVEEFYTKMGIGYLVVDRSKDEKMAKYENRIILYELTELDLDGFEDLLKLDMQDERAKILAQQWVELHKEQLTILEKLTEIITPKDWDDHKVHLQIHYDIVKSPEFYALPEWLRYIITVMIEQHRQMLGGVFSEQGSTVQKIIQKTIAPYVQPKMKEGANNGTENTQM